MILKENSKKNKSYRSYRTYKEALDWGRRDRPQNVQGSG